VGILTFGVLSEQIKTRIEQADEAKSTQVLMPVLNTCCLGFSMVFLVLSFTVHNVTCFAQHQTFLDNP